MRELGPENCDPRILFHLKFSKILFNFSQSCDRPDGKYCGRFNDAYRPSCRGCHDGTRSRRNKNAMLRHYRR